MANRVLVSPGVVRASLPGVDVLNPPSLTEAHLSLNSSWSSVERLHAFGKVSGAAHAGQESFNFFFPSLGTQPLATVVMLNPGTTITRSELLYYAFNVMSGNILYIVHGGWLNWRTYTDRVQVFRGLQFTGSTAGVSPPIQTFDYLIFVFKP